MQRERRHLNVFKYPITPQVIVTTQKKRAMRFKPKRAKTLPEVETDLFQISTLLKVKNS